MSMHTHLRWILVAAVNYLFWLVSMEAGHYLAPLALQLYIPGLLVTFAVLRLSWKHGLPATLTTALVVDATQPLSQGLTFVLFLVAFFSVYAVRSRFNREDAGSMLTVALCINLAFFLITSLALAPGQPSQAAYWQSVFVNLVLSQVAIFLLAGWFFSFQLEALRFLGIHLDREQREAQ